MANKRPTQADVAKLAGVSQAMVSYIVNNNPNVTIPDETRERILGAMNELEYMPNTLARGLKLGHTKTIGLIVPDNSNPFFAEFARFVENAGFENGYSVILCNSDHNIQKENSYLEALLAKQVDGVIFISSPVTGKATQNLLKSRTPQVIVSNVISGPTNQILKIDYKMGGYLATKHLLDLGHYEIACITGPTRSSSQSQRLDGYYQALDEAKISRNPTFVVRGDFRIRGGEAAMLHLLGLDHPPTAVFAFNDLTAIGAIQAVRNSGMRVPEDISVIGFDDIPLAQSISPALTTIAQPISAIADNAMDMLLRQIQDKPEHPGHESDKHQVVLEPELVVRESTCARGTE